jgi:translocation and assembly module TamB
VTALIRVPKGEFRIPDKPPPSVVTIDVVRIDSRNPQAAARKLAAARKQAAAPQRPTLATLDIKVVVPGQTFVRGRGLDSEWRGNIAITGSNAAPQIAGKLESVRGTIDLLGKTFTIRRGEITFPSGTLGDPRLDLLAEYDASDITAQVALTGSPTAPHLALSSTPQMPQDEILSRVLFGSDVGHITAAEGVQLALAARDLTSGGPGLMDRLRSTFGLDRLSVGGSQTTNPMTNLPQASMATGVPPSLASSSASGQSSTSPSLSGGKYIAPGVFVGVDQGASTQTTRAKVEVEMTRSLSAYSAVGANSGSQVGVDWRYDY